MDDDSIELNYASNSDVQLLQLPYKEEELSMFILLPRENNISSLEEDLNIPYMNDLLEKISAEYINLYLPKFRFDLMYELNDDLASMGMPTAFDTEEADFSGIASGSDKLSLSQVVHKSFIEVNEEGTEAAAATGAIMTSGGSSPHPISFYAGHPFIFFIQHKETSQILFLGKVEDPTV